MPIPSLMMPEQRQLILRSLKKGPQFNDRQMLGDFARQLYEAVTKKKLSNEVERHMKKWRESRSGKAEWNQTFIY